MSELIIRQIADGVSFKVKVVPGSSRTTIGGTLGGMLKMKVAAAAERGKANAALLDFLARELAVKRNSIRIVSGQSSPVKEIVIDGILAEQVIKLAAE
jgi:hypothetical protein